MYTDQSEIPDKELLHSTNLGRPIFFSVNRNKQFPSKLKDSVP